MQVKLGTSSFLSYISWSQEMLIMQSLFKYSNNEIKKGNAGLYRKVVLLYLGNCYLSCCFL